MYMWNMTSIQITLLACLDKVVRGHLTTEDRVAMALRGGHLTDSLEVIETVTPRSVSMSLRF